MKTKLLIDTSSNKEIKVRIRIDKKEYSIRRKIGINKTQVALPLIDELLRRKGLKITDIDKVKVDAGSGSFTGIRVGIAIANALSFALKIPTKMIK